MQNKTSSESHRTPPALGHLLLWSGFLVAAYSSVARREMEDKWSTIPWAAYLIALAVGFAGVILLRRAKAHDAADEAKTEAQYSQVRSSLSQLLATVERLHEETDKTPSKVIAWIDEECAELLADFVEARQAMIKRFGMTVYADVMTEFASAERLINRTWSAAADGYVDEVAASLAQAKDYLAQASRLLETAEAAPT